MLAFLDGLPVEAGAPGPARDDVETRNLVDVARAMARCALFREESRGGHYRSDFPSPDEARFRGHTLLEGSGPRLVGVELGLPVRA
jgi:succinate dehydrogenase/fumarate reductase flavoprotein subunit